MQLLLQVKVPRSDTTVIERQEFVEAGLVTTVQYDSTQIITSHGLRLMSSDLGMEAALDLLCSNVDEWGWASVIETPHELFEVTDCAGLIARPSYWDYETCLWWVKRQGKSLIHHFGHGARFAFMPGLREVREVRVED